MIQHCLTINGITCEVLDGNSSSDNSYKASFHNDGPASGSMRLKVAWGDHAALANYLLVANTFTVGIHTVVVGAKHPNYGMFACSVDVSTLGNPTGDFSWEYAILDVGYKSLQFDPANPSVVREDTIEMSGEVIPLLKESVTFDSDGSTLDRDAEQLITHAKYTVSIKGVRSVPLGAIDNCLNKIHSGSMTIRMGSTTYSVPGDRVLFEGPDGIKKTIMSDGSTLFDFSLVFLISPVPLNKEYNPNNTAADVYDRFEDVTPKKYKITDLSTLGV